MESTRSSPQRTGPSTICMQGTRECRKQSSTATTVGPNSTSSRVAKSFLATPCAVAGSAKCLPRAKAQISSKATLPTDKAQVISNTGSLWSHLSRLERRPTLTLCTRGWNSCSSRRTSKATCPLLLTMTISRVWCSLRSARSQSRSKVKVLSQKAVSRCACFSRNRRGKGNRQSLRCRRSPSIRPIRTLACLRRVRLLRSRPLMMVRPLL